MNSNIYYLIPEVTRMKTFQDGQQALNEIRTTLEKSGEAMRFATARISELETCLNRFIHAHEYLLSETDGTYPPADSGCIDCTRGTVPDKFNTGPCPYHTAKRLLGQL